MALTPELKKELFERIKAVLRKHAPPMIVAKDKEDVFELMGNKPVVYGSKKQQAPGMYFCSVIVNKTMISLHFFPIYFHSDDFIKLIPAMSKCLKGKTCFNIQKPGQVNEKELNALLKKGIEVWKKLGYMNTP
jgi:hypothetical protein